jgi:hypothetical protein
MHLGPVIAGAAVTLVVSMRASAGDKAPEQVLADSHPIRACRYFVANVVRLQLHALAYNLTIFMPRLAAFATTASSGRDRVDFGRAPVLAPTVRLRRKQPSIALEKP